MPTLVSVMAEHGLTDAVCGIAFDGTGYGVDGAIWGGEVLLANRSNFERFANFAYVPMPGGAAAIKHPLRMAYGRAVGLRPAGTSSCRGGFGASGR